jgi:hypothetical protein
MLTPTYIYLNQERLGHQGGYRRLYHGMDSDIGQPIGNYHFQVFASPNHAQRKIIG